MAQSRNRQLLQQFENDVDDQPGQDDGQVELDVINNKLLAGIVSPENILVALAGCCPQNRQVGEKESKAAEIDQGWHMPAH